jgi:hypothetical protein
VAYQSTISYLDQNNVNHLVDAGSERERDQSDLLYPRILGGREQPNSLVGLRRLSNPHAVAEMDSAALTDCKSMITLLG